MVTQLARNPRRTVAGLATVLAALGVAVGSGATFNAQTSNAENTFASGTLTHTNSALQAGVTLVTGANLKPGDVVVGTTKIKNTGSLAGTFTLSEPVHTSTFAATMLTLTIVEAKGAATRTVYSGDFGAMTAPIDLGSFADGEERTYTYTVTLVSSAPNSQQGKSANASYQWDEVQS